MNIKHLFTFFLILSSSFLCAEDSPFFFACSESGVNTNHLNTNFITNKKPDVDKERQLIGLGLIRLLKARVEDRIEKSENLIFNIHYCIDNPTVEKCTELNNWIDKEVPRYVREARYHVSLAQSNSNVLSWMGVAESEVNDDLSIWSHYKSEDWDEITILENEKALKTLAEYKAKIDKKGNELISSGKLKQSEVEDYKEDALLSIRYRHYLKYQLMMSQVHLLQYIKSADPTVDSIKDALVELKSNLEEEKKYIQKKAFEFEMQIHTSMELTNSLLELMSYSSLLEEVLLENPRYCNLAAALITYRQRRGIKLGMSIALPLIVGSFFVPPAAGIGVGLLAGTGFALHGQSNLNKKKMKSFGHVYGDEGGIEGQEVSVSKRMRDFDVVLMPIGLGVFGGSLSKIGTKLSPAISRLATKVTAKNLNLRSISTINSIKKVYSKFRL